MLQPELKKQKRGNHLGEQGIQIFWVIIITFKNNKGKETILIFSATDQLSVKQGC